MTDPTTVRRGRMRLFVDRAALVALVLCCVVLATGTAHAQEERGALTFDFEDAPSAPSGSPAPQVGAHYPDVTFGPGVVGLQFGDDSIPALPELPSSGRVVLGDCYAAEFCTNRVEAFFPRTVSGVSLLVGSRTPVAEPGVVALVGVDAQGQAFGPLDTTVVQASPTPLPVRAQLTLLDPQGSIAGFRLEWLEGSGSGLVLDDLTVVPPVIELSPDVVPGVLDASDGPSSAPIAFRNTGTAPLTVAALVVEPASVVGPGEFSLVDNGCDGASLGPDEVCSARVQLVSPEPGETSAEIVAILATEVVAASVGVSGFAEPSVPPTPDQRPTPSPTTDPPPGDDGGPGIGSLVAFGALLLAAVVLAVAAGRALSRRRARRPARRPAVRVRNRGTETDLSTPGADVSIRARLRLAEGQTTIEEEEAP